MRLGNSKSRGSKEPAVRAKWWWGVGLLTVTRPQDTVAAIVTTTPWTREVGALAGLRTFQETVKNNALL